MKDIRVKKSDLLSALRTNREQHNAVFLSAMEGYRKQAIEELERMVEEAKAGKQIKRGITLIEPVNQTKDYDRVIRMLEFETREEVELDESSFKCYVMDDWHWRRQFATANYGYTTARTSADSTTNWMVGE